MMTSSNMESTIESRTQGGQNGLSSGVKFRSNPHDERALSHLLVCLHTTRRATICNTAISIWDESVANKWLKLMRGSCISKFR